MIGVAVVVGWGVIVAHVACAGLLVEIWQTVECSHRILYTYLVVLIASFVSMMRLDENHGLQIEIFAMVAAALLVVSLPSAGYAAGQAEEELARQIQAYVPGVGVDGILAGAREWSAESGQDVYCA